MRKACGQLLRSNTGKRLTSLMPIVARQQPSAAAAGPRCQVHTHGQRRKPERPRSQPATRAAPPGTQPGPSGRSLDPALAEPRVIWPGFGTSAFWQSGVMQYLLEHYDMSRVPTLATSGGGLVAVLGACGVPPQDAVQLAFQLCVRAGVYERPLGLVGIWKGLVRDWLGSLLPEDAAERCRNVAIGLTVLPAMEHVQVSAWRSRDDLIAVALASAHIPLVLDGNLATRVRGRWVVDGSYHYAWLGQTHVLVPPGSGALVFDPRSDAALQARRRAQGPKVLDGAGAQQQVELGYEYVRAGHAEGSIDLDSSLGPYAHARLAAEERQQQQLAACPQLPGGLPGLRAQGARGPSSHDALAWAAAPAAPALHTGPLLLRGMPPGTGTPLALGLRATEL